MSVMPDGHYDVFVVDVEEIDAMSLRIEVAIVTGAQKGEVFAMRGPMLAEDPIELLGLPGTLDVVDGVPRLRVDR